MLMNAWIVAILLFLLVMYIIAFRLKVTFAAPDYFRDHEKEHSERYDSYAPYFELENIKCTVDI